ncbi:TetR/AcrR family transcriptional regulator [Microlunatus parietis]|uniref:AcrR family transcriptional regulator n=1 Tax=Microlunatus parietis TaxID=682979 RepID=A0A7Y9I9J3_9ACTN|nr:TetR/AcrR family transcriptional regulator [Microlunatus parietis]NYE72652.1 AcrR family transcriptional regulator [Microlunatus parietis]
MEAKVPYHHGSLRRTLIDVAVELIASHGVDGFTLAEAAKRAGVSAAAPYRHFAGKADLLGAIADDGFERLAADLREAVSEQAPDGGLVDLALAYVDFSVREPARFTVMFDAGGRAPRSNAGLAALGVLGGVLESLHARGRLAMPVDTALRATWSLAHGMAVLRLGGMRTIAEEDSPQLRRQVFTAMLAGVLRPD